MQQRDDAHVDDDAWLAETFRAGVPYPVDFHHDIDDGVLAAGVPSFLVPPMFFCSLLLGITVSGAMRATKASYVARMADGNNKICEFETKVEKLIIERPLTTSQRIEKKLTKVEGDVPGRFSLSIPFLYPFPISISLYLMWEEQEMEMERESCRLQR